MSGKLSRTVLATYSVPMIGVNFALVLVMVYFPKYSIDVLLIPPATVGLLFGLARIWDAVSDPFAGYLSDRTSTRFGRRRPWIGASLVPLSLFTWMCWSPPASLEGTALVAWMAVSILGFNTAVTVFLVPHQALGAELTSDARERTGVFGIRQWAGIVGAALAMVGGVTAINSAEDQRAAATGVALVTIAILVVTVTLAAVRLREPEAHRGRGGGSPFASFGDVFRNPHARVLLAMIFVEHMGSGAVMVAMPFFVEYVIGDPTGTALGIVFGFYTGTQLLVIPLWVRLARSIGSKRTWLVGICVQATGYLTIFSLVGEGDLWLMCGLTCFSAAGNASGTVMGSSMLADVVDSDDLETGERKEGAYYSGYTLLLKGSSGVMAMAAGGVLTATGFVPNGVQAADTQFAIRALITLVPAGCVMTGALVLTRYRLTEVEHAEIQEQLARRSRGAP